MYDFVTNITTQLLAFGAFLLLPGYGVYRLGDRLNRLYVQRVGFRRAILFTGWLGTPVHELSHALMARLFRFRVHAVKFFIPDSVDGTLGYVSYSPRGPGLVREPGVVLTALAPYFGGGLVIYLLLRCFVAESQALFDGTRMILTRDSLSPLNVLGSLVWALICNISFMVEQLDVFNWRHLLFLYLCLAVVAHMAPSRQDFQHCRQGFRVFVGAAVGVATLNLVLLKNNPELILESLRDLLTVPVVLLIMALTMGILTLAMSWLATIPWRRVHRG